MIKISQAYCKHVVLAVTITVVVASLSACSITSSLNPLQESTNRERPAEANEAAVQREITQTHAEILSTEENKNKGQKTLGISALTMESSDNEETQDFELDISDWKIYKDEVNGFRLKYPPSFGMPNPGNSRDFPGTDDKGVALRFTQASSGLYDESVVLESELIVTIGRIWVMGQALGGLHDSILLGGLLSILPLPLQDRLLAHVSSLDIQGLCSELSTLQHLDPMDPVLDSLNSEQKKGILALDQTRNLDPVVIQCALSDDTVTFHKLVTFKSGAVSERQHIFGAIRFLESPFSSVQFIRITIDQPDSQFLEEMITIVKSFEPLAGLE